MRLQQLERGQVLLYLAAAGIGLLLGSAAPAAATVAERLVWPVLGGLLYVTFLQVRLASLPAAFRNRRFLAAVLTGNFLLAPGLAWALTAVAGLAPAVTLGILLVLLVPCTDWYLSFTHLAGGDTAAALAVTPLNLLLQFALLPVYLWLLLGESVTGAVFSRAVATAFATLIAAPLLAAFLTERLSARRPALATLSRRGGALMVPLVALVVLLVATSQATVAAGAGHLLPPLTIIFGLFLAAATATGWLLARLLRLPPRPARAAMLSLATRNSFVVLPLALALPPPWQTAVVVIVYQSLVELFGLAVLIWLVPRAVPEAA